MIADQTRAERQRQVLSVRRLEEIERAMQAMGAYAMVGDYVTNDEIIAVIGELKRTRHPASISTPS